MFTFLWYLRKAFKMIYVQFSLLKTCFVSNLFLSDGVNRTFGMVKIWVILQKSVSVF